MNVTISGMHDFRRWLDLAGEVEHLFGPMAGEPSFRSALEQAIREEHAFCIREDTPSSAGLLKGGIVIATETNEILWLVVSSKARGSGCGKALLEYALARLDNTRPVQVQTFAPSVPDGLPARRLYQSFGFLDHAQGGLNPAGIDTVIMHRLPLRLNSI